jgi:hypothetical protein
MISGSTSTLPFAFSLITAHAGSLFTLLKFHFDFKNIDFLADRYIIDIIDGQIEDKYLAFPQRGEKIP